MSKFKTADFNEDLEWSQQGHLFLAAHFYPQYAYNGQFVFCDRTDKQERGALLIQKKLHIDTIIQRDTALNAICIDEKIVKGYYKKFTLETHSITSTPKMPVGLGDGCVMQSSADEMIYCFPTRKKCNCVPLSRQWQKCTHPISAVELYIIDLQTLQQWFSQVYARYPWRSIRNKGYWTHVRIVPILDVYQGIGHEHIIKNIIKEAEGLKREICYFEDATGQIALFPYKNKLAYFIRQKKE